jgi:ferredoxin-NADP reductase
MILAWQAATAVAFQEETANVRTITFAVPKWTGHLAGQHVDLRLTAEDGYRAERSYSIASKAGAANRIDLTVERLVDGEVSSYLTEELVVGDSLELRGPIGGYFIWEPTSTAPLMLIAGGSGVVPLMSMLRTRDRAAREKAPARLLYSSRTPDDIIYRLELERLAANDAGFSLIHTVTRVRPAGWSGESRRVDREMLAAHVFPASRAPRIFICGPTLFVETVADQLLSLGHDPSAIATERFGPSGSRS